MHHTLEERQIEGLWLRYLGAPYTGRAMAAVSGCTVHWKRGEEKCKTFSLKLRCLYVSPRSPPSSRSLG